MKKYFKYVNQWELMFWMLISSQLVLGIVRNEDILVNIWGCGLIWALFSIGRNSFDRDLEINLTRAKERIAQENADL